MEQVQLPLRRWVRRALPRDFSYEEALQSAVCKVYPSFMRLDKFLKLSRLSKRRAEAHEALEHGRVSQGGRALKPGYRVKVGDVLEIHFATKFVTVRVKDVPLRMSPGIKPAELYEILDQRQDDAW